MASKHKLGTVLTLLVLLAVIGLAFSRHRAEERQGEATSDQAPYQDEPEPAQ